MGKTTISQFLGLNASQASLTLRPGEMVNIQNIRQRPFDNWVKRRGVENSTVHTSPVLGIFEADFDNVIIPIVQNGSTLTFYPDLSSDNGSFEMPDPYPYPDPLDPPGNNITLFNIEQTMRAIQDRRATAGHAEVTWPNLIFKSDGTQWNGNTGIAVSNYPVNNLYGPDLTYHDAFYGNPIGTRAASLVNTVIGVCITTVDFDDWVISVEGLADPTIYDSSIFPTAGSATRSTYKSSLAHCKTGIRKLTSLRAFPTQVEVSEKSAAAGDTATCGITFTGACYKIKDYGDGYFNSDACTSCADSSDPGWNGQFTQTFPGLPCLLTVDSVNRSISEKRFSGNGGIGFDGASNFWIIDVLCMDGATSSFYMWRGRKIYGSDPSGIYVSTGSGSPCSSNVSSLIVEPC